MSNECVMDKIHTFIIIGRYIIMAPTIILSVLHTANSDIITTDYKSQAQLTNRLTYL